MPDSTGKRVLLIEDHTMLRQLLTIHLSNAGYGVSEAATVRDAIDALDDRNFDLIITDVHLPDGDTISWLREDLARMHVPVIFITGDGDHELAEKVLAEDPAGFLVKPFDFNELLSVAANALRDAPSYNAGERANDVAQPIPVLLRPPSTDHSRHVPLRTLLQIGCAILFTLIGAFVVGILLHE